MDFKDHAIYQLPNGRELIAVLSQNRGTVFHNLSPSHAGQYELNQEGRLLLNGSLTAWGVEDLLETGRQAPQDLLATVLDDPTRDTDITYERNLSAQ